VGAVAPPEVESGVVTQPGEEPVVEVAAVRPAQPIQPRKVGAEVPKEQAAGAVPPCLTPPLLGGEHGRTQSSPSPRRGAKEWMEHRELGTPGEVGGPQVEEGPLASRSLGPGSPAAG
jgi:hypothetical protein